MEELEAKTPREYLEACRRLIVAFEVLWDELPDGDGNIGSLDEGNATKTDMFNVVAGCADYGKAAIREQNEVKRLLTF